MGGLDTNYEITSRKSGFGPLPEQKNRAFYPTAYEAEPLYRSALAARERERAAKSARYVMLDAMREIMPGHRVASCLRLRRGDSQVNGVQISRDEDTRTAIFSNLAVCGSIWGCPVCSEAISRKRGDELREAGRVHLGRGGGFALVTLTFRHRVDKDGKAEKPLPVMLADFQAAREDLHRQRAFRKLLEDFRVVGSVRGLEVTHGANGWHPHTHDLLFLFAPWTPAQSAEFQFRYWKLWRKQARDHGLEVLRDAFNVRATTATDTAEDVADMMGYPTKNDAFTFDGGWDAAAEVTRAPAKLGRRGGRTVMQLLHDYTFHGDERAGHLVVEAVKAFHRLKALVWSRGLSASLGLADPAGDQDASEEVRAEYREWMIVVPDDWRAVLRSGRGARAKLRELAGLGDRGAVCAFLAACGRGEVRDEYRSLVRVLLE